MIVLKQGTHYAVEGYNDKDYLQEIKFIEKSKKKDFVAGLKEEGKNEEEIKEVLISLGADKLGDNETFTVQNGTTTEEVLSILIHRIFFLNKKKSSNSNIQVINKLKEAKHWLQDRFTKEF
jgi:hypothetical protein